MAKLGNVNKINEACLDLQKSSKPTTDIFALDIKLAVASKKGPCPHLPAWDNNSKWNEFRDHALVNKQNTSTCEYAR